MAGQDLGDVLAGAAGAPVNRPALNLMVAQSQTRNGLVSAQTQDAILKAQQAQEEQDAHGRLEQEIQAANPDMRPSEVSLAKDLLVSHFGNDPVTALKTMGTLKLGFGNPAQQTSGQQMVQGKVAEPVALPNNYTTLPGTAPVVPQQSPEGVQETRLHGAQANLAQTQADNPQLFHPGGAGALGNLTPEEQGALNNAVSDGRQDPTRINSRNAKIIARMELANPGQTNFNRLHADAVLQSNAGYQQKAMSVDMLPGLLSHVVALGKKLDNGAGYSDLRTVGTMQKWLNGEVNDPDYTEFMTARNDTLLRLAGVMRGVGMSDQAHTAEVEAMSPTLAPYALDAWLKGQMSVVTPLLDRQNRITHLGEKGQGTAPLTSSAAPTAPAAPTGGQTMPDAATLQEYARVHFSGDVGKATQYLTSKGFK